MSLKNKSRKGKKKETIFQLAIYRNVRSPLLMPFPNGWSKIKFLALTQLPTQQHKVLTLSLSNRAPVDYVYTSEEREW